MVQIPHSLELNVPLRFKITLRVAGEVVRQRKTKQKMVFKVIKIILAVMFIIALLLFVILSEHVQSVLIQTLYIHDLHS